MGRNRLMGRTCSAQKPNMLCPRAKHCLSVFSLRAVQYLPMSQSKLAPGQEYRLVGRNIGSWSDFRSIGIKARQTTPRGQKRQVWTQFNNTVTNFPICIPTKLKPTFKLVQAVKGASKCRLSLVLDISGSMNDDDKLAKMNKGLQKLIRYTVREGTEIGTSYFSNMANVSVFEDECVQGLVQGWVCARVSVCKEECKVEWKRYWKTLFFFED